MTKLALTAAALAVCGSLALPFARAGAEEHGGAAPKAGDGDHQAAKDGREGQKGTVVGVVSEIDAAKGDKLVVTDDSGKRERYAPQWIGGSPKDGGGLDPKMVAQIKALHVGDRVSIDWTFDERLRVVRITGLEGSKAGGAIPGGVIHSGGGPGQP